MNRLNEKATRQLLTKWLCLFGFISFIFAQTTVAQESEHLKHHPELAQSESEGDGGSNNNAPKMGGMMGEGMMAGMGKMMEKMGAPKPKQLYPSLMSLPDLPMEKRDELQGKAHERMKSGAALMSDGFESLSRAAPTDDFKSMQQSVAKVRQGLSQFDSGLATHRALAEGKAPKNVALTWFKREMNLPFPGSIPQQFSFFGMSLFHTGIMTILVVVSFTLLFMYWYKMRRANALLLKLTDPTTSVPTPASRSAEVPSSEVAEAPAFALAPLTGKQSGPLQISRILYETPTVKTFRLVHEDGGPIHFSYLPGQFLTLTVDIDGNLVKRSYTIASSPTQRYYCEITVKREEKGLVSRYLHDQVREGDNLDIIAPSGKFTFTGAEADSIVLIGGGVGITPLMSVIRYLVDAGWKKDIFLLYSCRSSDEFIFDCELKCLERRHPNLHITVIMSQMEQEVPGVLKGRITKEIIENAVPNISSRRVHHCGPPPMMNAVKTMLLELGVAKEQIYAEAFGPPPKSNKTPIIQGETTEATVTFKPSGKSAPLPENETILDVADKLEIQIESSCLVGSCGTCIVKLLSGEVTMECEDGLEPEDREQGMVLACQAKSKGKVVVEV